MTEPTEKQKRQFNIWVEENPHKMKQLMDEYQENYVEEGDELENRNGFWADLLSQEIARYQFDCWLRDNYSKAK